MLSHIRNARSGVEMNHRPNMGSSTSTNSPALPAVKPPPTSKGPFHRSYANTSVSDGPGGLSASSIPATRAPTRWRYAMLSLDSWPTRSENCGTASPVLMPLYVLHGLSRIPTR
ncbi:hypothetical protein RRF57_012578 [Xylaria bambusicola]|uniref:Uncharacterized protein n=1 Tax=Xylaria bambusicola TaxID=326684 RepID=A0AAN7V0Q2_9PEZI